MRISIDDLEVGDRLLSDAMTTNGVNILAADSIVEAIDIIKLKRHRISEVDIELRKRDLPSLNGPHDPKSLEAAYAAAVQGIKIVFLQVSAGKGIDEAIVDRIVEPLVDRFAQEQDVVSLLIELRSNDEYTYHHSVQVGMLSYFIAKWLGKSEKDCLLAGKAGYLHDIGKSRFDMALLNKATKLTDAEYEEVMKHTEYGSALIMKYLRQPLLARVALEHHERLDGSGYPHGLAGKKIHPLSRIVALADIYSAMTSSRAYQQERDLLDVLREIHALGFSKLDPKITQVFITRMLPHFIGKSVQLNNGRTGQIVMMHPTDPFRPLLQIEEQFIDLTRHLELRIVKMLP